MINGAYSNCNVVKPIHPHTLQRTRLELIMAVRTTALKNPLHRNTLSKGSCRLRAAAACRLVPSPSCLGKERFLADDTVPSEVGTAAEYHLAYNRQSCEFGACGGRPRVGGFAFRRV